jgi:hypothetical protein
VNSYFLEENILDYIERVAELASLKVKIFLGGEKNAPKKNSRYEIYTKDGGYYASGSWSQCIASIKQLAESGVEFNFPKMRESLEKFSPNELNRTIIVEYMAEQPLEELRFTYELVERNSRKMTAAEFKKWLPEYLDRFDNIEYYFEEATGVKKILKELEELISK